MEVFLYQLYAMLKADPYNVTLLSGQVCKSKVQSSKFKVLHNNYVCLIVHLVSS